MSKKNYTLQERFAKKMSNIVTFIKSISIFVRGLDTINFIRFNFRRNHLRQKGDSIVLLEYTPMQSVILAVSLLVRALGKKYQGAKFIAYTFDSDYRYSPHLRLIYRSFGAEVRQFKISHENKVRAKEELFKIIELNLNNNDLVRLRLNGIMIGDLIYDHHLRHHHLPTLSLKDDLYINTLREGLEQYFFFEEYMKNNNVKAVHVTHQCYFNAIPLRIAADQNVEVFNCHESECQRFTSDRLWSGKENTEYHSIFNSFSAEQKAKYIEWSKLRIEKRFSGEVGVDMHYSKKSAFGAVDKSHHSIGQSDKVKVLVAAHCFFDAANGWGVNFFPDFYQWISALGDISNKTDYDWYIKTHPDYIPGNNEVLNELISKYPNLTILEQNTSHLQIVNDGIDFVLTVYGTVAFEYAAMGITVINASLFNRHITYDFNINPSSKKEYINLLLNLSEKVKIEINKNDVYEFYYMSNRYFNTDDWLILELDKFRLSDKLMSPKIYAEYINLMEGNKSEMNKRLSTFNEFVFGNDTLMTHQSYRG